MEKNQLINIIIEQHLLHIDNIFFNNDEEKMRSQVVDSLSNISTKIKNDMIFLFNELNENEKNEIYKNVDKLDALWFLELINKNSIVCNRRVTNEKCF